MASAPAIPATGVYDIQVRDASGQWVVYSAFVYAPPDAAPAEAEIQAAFQAGFAPIVTFFFGALAIAIVVGFLRRM